MRRNGNGYRIKIQVFKVSSSHGRRCAHPDDSGHFHCNVTVYNGQQPSQRSAVEGAVYLEDVKDLIVQNISAYMYCFFRSRCFLFHEEIPNWFKSYGLVYECVCFHGHNCELVLGAHLFM
jgi:hypothetical protein